MSIKKLPQDVPTLQQMVVKRDSIIAKKNEIITELQHKQFEYETPREDISLSLLPDVETIKEGFTILPVEEAVSKEDYDKLMNDNFRLVSEKKIYKDSSEANHQENETLKLELVKMTNARNTLAENLQDEVAKTPLKIEQLNKEYNTLADINLKLRKRVGELEDIPKDDEFKERFFEVRSKLEEILTKFPVK